jgi:hypothetical protein
MPWRGCAKRIQREIGMSLYWSKVVRLGAIVVVSAGLFGLAKTYDRTRIPTRVTAYAKPWALYNPDPNHLWNRVYRALYQRVDNEGKEQGFDELDPLLWGQTKYLFGDPASREAVNVLDEFLTTHGERALDDPLKRAVLQRDLWAVFDWTARSEQQSPQKLTLQTKLAQVIRRLALRSDEIARLPNSYDEAIRSKTFPPAYDAKNPTQPFLPPDLFDPNGPWVMMSARGGQPVALSHVYFASGRSAFLIFIRLPGARTATLNYLKSLAAFPRPWIRAPEGPLDVKPNPNLPQFPAGTQLALVRLANVVDGEGSLRATPIIEDIQLRVHRVIPNDLPDMLNLSRNEAAAALDGFEFKLSRSKLFAHDSGGLRAVLPGEKEFALFQSHDFEFEQREPLAMCASCHFQPGVHSMLSRGRLEPGGRQRVEIVPSWAVDYEATTTTSWKHNQYNWGLLQGLWRGQPAN